MTLPKMALRGILVLAVKDNDFGFMIQEHEEVIKIVSKYIDLTVTPFGHPIRSVVRVDTRYPMYGGSGVAYLLQMFAEKDELVNNRIGAYMALLSKGDQSGFHNHGDRNEQELYITLHGVGEYSDKDGVDGSVRTQLIKKGSITSIRGTGQHSVKNIGDEPLIVFVITTNEQTS